MRGACRLVLWVASLLGPALPASATPECGAGAVFRSGMEALEPADASGGSTDLATGSRALQFLPPLGGAPRTYHVFVPAAYTPGQAWPLVVALHGAPGSPSLSDPAAQAIRDAWITRAQTAGFLVLAPVASGPSFGSWIQSDIDAIFAAIADFEARYNIDRRRRYLWGFSAGGHFSHGIALGRATYFAAYAVNAGVLGGFAGNLAPQLASCRVPLSVRIGDGDSPGLLANARSDRDLFDAAGWVSGVDRQYAEFSGGHTFDATDLDAHWAWFAPRQVP